MNNFEKTFEEKLKLLEEPSKQEVKKFIDESNNEPEAEIYKVKVVTRRRDLFLRIGVILCLLIILSYPVISVWALKTGKLDGIITSNVTVNQGDINPTFNNPVNIDGNTNNYEINFEISDEFRESICNSS